jgi:uncharacterized protein (DUF58 family)
MSAEAAPARASRQGLRAKVDWGNLSPLRLRARILADGVWAGAHRSARRGTGIEFGGFREYVPGDDLRFLDRRSLLRFERLQVRQFETETDRAVRLLVDATTSMAYVGSRAIASKYAYASLLAAALAHVASASGDPAGLAFLSGEKRSILPLARGREAFERIVAALESQVALGDGRGAASAQVLDSIDHAAKSSRRGSVIAVFSDLADLPLESVDRMAALAARNRRAVVVRVNDPDELDFPFEGSLRLRSLEGKTVVETDGQAKARYLERFLAWERRLEDALVPRGVRLVYVATNEEPEKALRRILTALL